MIELPVATRHRRDMTEKMMKATLNPNKQQQTMAQTHHPVHFQPYHAPNDGTLLFTPRCAAYIFVVVFFEYLRMRNFSVFSICSHWFYARVQYVLHTTGYS